MTTCENLIFVDALIYTAMREIAAWALKEFAEEAETELKAKCSQKWAEFLLKSESIITQAEAYFPRVKMNKTEAKP